MGSVLVCRGGACPSRLEGPESLPPARGKVPPKGADEGAQRGCTLGFVPENGRAIRPRARHGSAAPPAPLWGEGRRPIRAASVSGHRAALMVSPLSMAMEAAADPARAVPSRSVPSR